MQAATTNASGWHIRNWGLWGWLETGAKGAGIAAGLGSLALSPVAQYQFAGADYGLVGLFALLTVVAGGVIALRVMQQELFAIVFALLNFAGHGALLYSLFQTPAAITSAVVLGTAFVAGELLKQRFLLATGYTESGNSTAKILSFSRTFMVLYGLVIGLALL